MNELDESVPVAVELDAPELQQGLGPLADPAQAALVEALADDVTHGGRAPAPYAPQEPRETAPNSVSTDFVYRGSEFIAFQH